MPNDPWFLCLVTWFIGIGFLFTISLIADGVKWLLMRLGVVR